MNGKLARADRPAIGRGGNDVAAGLTDLLEIWRRWEAWHNWTAQVARGERGQVFGLAGGLPALAVAALADLGPLLVVTPSWSRAERLAAELATWVGDERVWVLPPRPALYGLVAAASHEWEHQRLAAFRAMAERRDLVVVTPAEAARQLVRPWRPEPVRLVWGGSASRDAVMRQIQALGYERLSLVEQPGQWALRGAVMDVFPPGEQPIRVEWFGDDVDRLVTFDAATQRAGDRLAEVVIGPAREVLWTSSDAERALAVLTPQIEQVGEALRGIGESALAEDVQARWQERAGWLLDGRPWPGVERIAAALGPVDTLCALFAEPPVVVLDDRERVLEAVRGRTLEERAEQQRRLERGDLLPVECETTLDGDTFLPRLAGRAQVALSLLPHQRHHGERLLTVNGRPAPRAHGQWDLLLTEVQRLRKSRHRVVLVVKDEAVQREMVGRLVDAEVPVHRTVPAAGETAVLVGQLGQGFILPELGLAVLTETEMTGREVKPRRPMRRSVTGNALVKLAELAPGDYVVHVTHGVARYRGVVTLMTSGVPRDYLHLEYAEQDALYVPVEQLDLVQRYAGLNDRPPRLSRLGGADWSRTKARVKASVREMASELLALYAARQARPGFDFGPDTPWQQEFENAFPYEDTPDQRRAAEEIKADMARPRPMDRLLLGDVGYGKTEVALRAAFKAIMAGKQVAFLVPTTLLAEQHLATARTRIAGYPIRVEVLSRFRGTREQKEILASLASGQVDLVIGTHRLLAADVVFKDLGLLIVDEEHRFGVAHKERIKRLKETVDVLTLTATPIPRTLHMAMVGVRDMSVIETPPEERLPVETMVAEWDPDLIREAIQRELDRQGQVYYVQNRIRAMDGTLARLRELVPEARIAVAHGRMAEEQLEEVMARFLAQEYDILVATSIIESGLDIPNVNTLVVEDADRLGLAQLYQLRGRVGRSERLAYAYFTYRRDRRLTPEAEQRLQAIQQFTELGAGYQIALRDLEIRGAGNLLGPEQHGFVAAVGFELYTQLLAEAVRELKGEQAAAPVDTALEFQVSAYLPESYIPDEGQKIAAYKRLVSCTHRSEVEALAEELEDRYGPPPEPVRHLLRLTRIRVLARELGLAQVTHRRDRLVLRLSRQGEVKGEQVAALGRKYPGRLLQMTGRSPELGFRLMQEEGEAVLETAEAVLETLCGAS
jgi:transcription-repair coupling factor (superfamily II helicase)